MKRYDLYILDTSKATVAAMPNSAWEISETLNIEDTIRAALYEVDKFDLVTAENTFIRLVNPDDSTDIRTYRVTSVEQSRANGRHVLQCEGTRIWADMGREIYEGWHPFRNIQVKTIVAELLGSSAFQIKSGGDAESDTTLIESLDFAYTSVLEGLQRVAELADLEIEIDESTSPESIDLKTRGSDNNVRFEYGISASGLARRFRRAEVVNKAYPVGGGVPPATCEGALFEVYGISTNTVTVAGDKCIPSDDTYNTFKIEFVTGSEAGTAYTISDTTRGSSGDDDTIVLSSTPSSVSAGDLFKFTDSSGNELAYVPDAASQSTYGTFDGAVKDPQFEAIRTLIVPGFMDGTYASGLHDGWTKTGTPTVAENTDIAYIQHGQSSQHVNAASDTHGIYYDVSLDSSDYYSCAVNLYVVSGSVEVKITTSTSTGAVTYNNQGGTSGTGWLTVELEGLPIEGSTARLTIAATGGAAEFYIDAVSFTGTQQTRAFVRENGARELYRMAFDYLDEHDAPVVEYDIPNAMDLYQIDPANYPFNDVEIGDTITVVDPAMSLAASVRVLSLGRDNMGRHLRLKLSTHVSTMAAFSQVAPGAGRVVSSKRRAEQDETNGRRNNETGASIAQRINKIASNAARASRFTGDMTATGQTSLDVGSGTLYVGDNLSYSIDAQTISGLTGNSVYYLYFDPTSASSGLQTTTTAATAYGRDNIQVGVLKTGASSDDNVQIYDTTGAQVSGEILTRGVEAYDTSGNKRIDIGVLQDPSASIGNPGTWGIQINDGVSQNTSLLAEYTGSIPGAVRYQYVTFGDENEDLTYDTTTQIIYGDYSYYAAKSSANLFAHRVEGQLVSGSSGDLYGYAAGSSLLNSGSGDAFGYYTGIIQTAGGGHAYGLYVGDSLGVRSTSTGNAYGIYINAVTSTSGTAYSIYDNTTNRARFGGSISVRGVDYVWPSSDGTANYVLSTDGSGNLSWVSNLTGGAVTGSGTTNYIPKWSSSSALTDSVIYDDGTNVGIGVTPTYVLDVLSSVAVTARFQNNSTDAMVLFLKNADATTNTWGIAIGGSLHSQGDGSFYISRETGGPNFPFVIKSDLNIVMNGGGHLSIGNADGDLMLHVKDTQNIALFEGTHTNENNIWIGESIANDSALIVGYNQTSNYGYVMVAGDSPTDGLTVIDGGAVGVGGTPINSDKLYIHASTGANVAGFFSSHATNNEVAIGGSRADNDSLIIGFNQTSNYGYIQVWGDSAGSSLVVADGGNVGIGTSSPSAKTHIVNSGSGIGHYVVQSGVLSASTQASLVYSNAIQTNAGAYLFRVYSDNASSTSDVVNIRGDGSGNLLSLDSGGTELVVFDSSGNVGIDVDPSYLLHVGSGGSVTGAPVVAITDTVSSASSNGLSIAPYSTGAISTAFYGMTVSAQLSGTISQTAPVYGLIVQPVFTSGVTATTVYGIYVQGSAFGTITNEYAFYAASGSGYNVFAGDTMVGNAAAPSSTLHVYDGSSGTSSGIRLENNSGTDWGMGELVFNNTFSIYDFGASDGRLNIDSSGNVGIGTQTPAAKLQVTGSNVGQTVLIEDTNAGAFGAIITLKHNSASPATTDWLGGFVFQGNDSAGNAHDYAQLRVVPVDTTNGSEDGQFEWYISEAGAAAAQRMYLTSAGALYNSANVYGGISDIRLKTDVQVARSYWEDFKGLQYKTYKFIQDGENAAKRLGLVAQDVEVVFPSLVQYNTDGYKSVKNSVIGEIGNSVLIEAQKRIEELEAEVAALKAAA